MDKKYLAKKKMLEKMSGDIKDKMYGSLGDELKGKKLSKVTVASDSPEGLKKGISLAEKLLAKKFGQSDKKEDKSEESEEMEHSCPMCEDEGCEECEEVEEEEAE